MRFQSVLGAVRVLLVEATRWPGVLRDLRAALRRTQYGMPVKRTVLLVGIALAGAAAGWAIARGDSSASEQDESNHAVVERVSFQADGGAGDEPILKLGGLTLRAACADQGQRTGTQLSVSAESAYDDAVIGSSFIQDRGSHQPYAFLLPDFDRSYGPWDFLGGNPNRTSGQLNYSRPDGGQVTVTFLADHGTAQGGCFLGGTAAFAPVR